MLDIIFYGVVIPVFIVGAGLFFLRRFQESIFLHLWAIAYLVAHVGVGGGLEFPPLDVVNWMPVFAISGVLVSRIGLGLFTVPVPYRLLAGALGVMGLTFVLLRPLIHQGFISFVTFFVFLSGPLFLTALIPIRRGLQNFSKVQQSKLRVISLWILSGCVSITLLLSGSALYGQLLGCTAAVMTTVLLVQFFGKRWEFAEFSFQMIFLFDLAFVLLGYFYSQLHGASALLLALALPVGLGVPHSFFARFRKMNPMYVRVGLVSIGCGIAVALAFIPFILSDPQSGYY